jgi:hypothetical protein
MQKYFFTAVLLLLLFLLLGCKTVEEYVMLEDAAPMQEYVDKKVCLTGEVSDIPWQHMIAFVEGHPYSEYFDVRDYQIVIYAKTQIQCRGMVKLYGTVLKVEGKGKRPDPGDELYVEYHLIVDKWECLE